VQMMKGEVAAEFIADGDGKVASVSLKSGGTIDANIVIVGVGATTVVDYCEGLTMEKGGFAVDGQMQTSDPNVYAIGDIAAFPSQYGGLTRCEHVDNARKSAAQAVQAAMGKHPEPYAYLPYFYSRIFEYTDAPIVFNFFGSEAGHLQVTSRGEKSIGAIWVNEGKVAGALLMGSPGPSADDMGKLRELVVSAPTVDEVPFEVGEAVEGLREGSWFPGKIEGALGGGKFMVAWEDGDGGERMQPKKNVRRPNAAETILAAASL